MRAGFAHPDTLPIPDDVAIGPGWSSQMVEMAEHIGAHATLLIVAAVGGEFMYIPEDPARNRLREIVGEEKARILSHVYGRERIHIPTGRDALRYARRQPIIAAARARLLTITDAARMLGSTQSYVSRLVNHTAEGTGAAIPVKLRKRLRVPDGQLDLFGE